ncbi:related to 3'--_5' exonuclease and endonuclease [Pseudozyma flocculosa]|nr:related to 3'-->5' exonuclease and endonuclease [Pseudozyma flocculosa]
MASASASEPTPALPRFIDIGVNLTDPIFRGNHHGKQAHDDDFGRVLERAKAAGVVGQIITGGNLQESQEALELAHGDDTFYSTVGCHPTRTSEMESHPDGAEAYLAQLSQLIQASRQSEGDVGAGKGQRKVVAIGECGLDYDRLHFSPAEVQKRHFASQLDLAVRWQLPLFLHSRAAHADFAAILKPRIQEIHDVLSSSSSSPSSSAPHPDDAAARRVGVVHSFTGTLDEMRELVDLGLFIGINGCSLKTQDNLDVVKAIPLSRLMLETDAPWCDPRSTHASASHIQALKASRPDLHALYQPASAKKEKWRPDAMVKGRNEPCVIGAVAATVASVKGLALEEVAEAAMRNTRWLFGL